MAARNPGKLALLTVAVASGESVRAASARLGIPLGTANRWHLAPEFKAEVRRLRDEFTSEALGKLASEATKSVEVLAQIRDDAKAADTVRVMAAGRLLDKLASMAELHDLAERVRALEERTHVPESPY